MDSDVDSVFDDFQDESDGYSPQVVRTLRGALQHSASATSLDTASRMLFWFQPTSSDIFAEAEG